MRGGGGWFKVGRGWMNRVCCCSGGGCRWRVGVVGSVGRRSGGGWFRVVMGVVGVGVDDGVGGDGFRVRGVCGVCV